MHYAKQCVCEWNDGMRGGGKQRLIYAGYSRTDKALVVLDEFYMFCSGSCMRVYVHTSCEYQALATATTHFTRVLRAQTVHLNNGEEWPTYCVCGDRYMVFSEITWWDKFALVVIVIHVALSLAPFVRSLSGHFLEMYGLWLSRLDFMIALIATASSSRTRDLHNNNKRNFNKNDAIITLPELFGCERCGKKYCVTMLSVGWERQIS